MVTQCDVFFSLGHFGHFGQREGKLAPARHHHYPACHWAIFCRAPGTACPLTLSQILTMLAEPRQHAGSGGEPREAVSHGGEQMVLMENMAGLGHLLSDI